MNTLLPTAIYLLGFYWPYALGALLIGVVAGWFSYSKRQI